MDKKSDQGQLTGHSALVGQHPPNDSVRDVSTLVSWLHCLLAEHLSFLVIDLEPVSHLTKGCSDIMNQSCVQRRKSVTNVLCTPWDVVVSLLQNVPPFKSRR